MQIIAAHTKEYLDIVRQLFIEYANSIKIDLCFQDFNQELAGLPGKYAPPEGCLLLAMANNDIIGCVALRKLQDGICEIKRLYIRPAFRGKRMGKELVKAVIVQAKNIGYKKMRLDTLSTMKEAVALYRSFGFRDIKPYYNNPIPDAIYLELEL